MERRGGGLPASQDRHQDEPSPYPHGWAAMGYWSEDGYPLGIPPHRWPPGIMPGGGYLQCRFGFGMAFARSGVEACILPLWSWHTVGSRNVPPSDLALAGMLNVIAVFLTFYTQSFHCKCPRRSVMAIGGHIRLCGGTTVGPMSGEVIAQSRSSSGRMAGETPAMIVSPYGPN
jgi:hypothetical protein